MIKHLVMDVDGVLNTGQMLYSSEGKSYKVFGPHDRDGIKIAINLGLSINFITADARGFSISYARIVTDWGFNSDQLHLVTEADRLSWISSKFNMNEVAYIGDGIHDAPILSAVKLGIAPSSARKEAKLAADFITESAAGNGAVLDACLIIQRIINEEI